MAKIPFDIEYKPQIESGEYTVETRNGKPVRVVCWDRAAKESQPKHLKLCVLVQEDGGESVYYYYPDGTKWVACDDYDLFIITPEPELSDFDKALEVFLMNADSSEETFHEEVKKHAAELLSLAREQFIKDGYVIEKKAFHDAVGKVASEVMKEVSDKVDMEGALRLGYENGRADALKDLPRWENVGGNTSGPTSLIRGIGGNDMLYHNGKTIWLSDLEKLPGFKEDGHE